MRPALPLPFRAPPWAASAYSPTRSPTRSPPARWSSAPPRSSRNCSRTRSTPAPPNFSIEVESGGRRLIRVADDGCGMLRDDALLAFERHATSKLTDVKDLLSIATLGFRGEALPSIASVSRLVLETRSAEEATGMRVEIAGGKLLRADEAALAPGTTVTVRDLFYNVPARKKFLRTEQTELAHIASLVTHYSLAHPDKSFLLRSGANELLQRHAGGDACASASTRSSAARSWMSWSSSARASANSSCRRPTCRPRRRWRPTRAEPEEPAAAPSACAASSRGRSTRS